MNIANRVIQEGDIVEVISKGDVRFASLSIDAQRRFEGAYNRRMDIRIGAKGVVTKTWIDIFKPNFFALVDFTSVGHYPPILMRGDEITTTTTAEEIQSLVDIIEPSHHKIVTDWLDSLRS